MKKLKKQNNFFATLIYCVIFCFSMNGIGLPVSTAWAQSVPVLGLPAPGTMLTLSPSTVPPMMKGLRIHPNNPLKFNFILDSGSHQLDKYALEEETTKLIKYFMASLTIPEEDLWVNLSPYESKRIIPENFALTEMGRDLLAQDYILKQITASLIYPEDELGREFWQKVYDRAERLYGTTDIPVNTFNKVWIVPDKVVIHQAEDTAFIIESHLKVMLEQDYMAMRHNETNGQDRTDNNISTPIMREVVIPALEEEVNHGQHFAQLRQIYQSLILAAWFKKNLRDSFLGKNYVEQNKTLGVDVDDPDIKEKIYQQYLEAFQQGVFDYIKEDYDVEADEMIPHQYFSGGTEMKVEHLLDDGDDRTVGRDLSLWELRAALEGSTEGVLLDATAFLEDAHQDYHTQGRFKETIELIASDVFAEYGIQTEPDQEGTYDLVDMYRRFLVLNKGDTIFTAGGKIYMKDGVLIIIDNRFEKDHAGRGRFQLAVYARTEEKAEHEFEELRLWKDFWNEFKTREGLVFDSTQVRGFGQEIREWANDPDVTAETRKSRQEMLIERYYAFHRQGLIAEGVGEKELPPEVQKVELSQDIDDFGLTVSSDGTDQAVYNYPNYKSEEARDAYFQYLMNRASRYKETLNQDDFEGGYKKLFKFIADNPKYIQQVINIDPDHYYSFVKGLWEEQHSGKTYLPREAFDRMVASLNRPTLDQHPELITVLFDSHDMPREFSVPLHVLEENMDITQVAEELKDKYKNRLADSLNAVERIWSFETAPDSDQERIQKRLYAYLAIKRKQGEEKKNALIKGKQIKGYLAMAEEQVFKDQTPLEALQSLIGVSTKDMIEALFVVTAYDVSQKKQPATVLLDMVYAYAYAETAIQNNFDEDADAISAVSSLDQIVNDRYRELQKATHLLDSDRRFQPQDVKGNPIIPNAVSKALDEIRREITPVLVQQGENVSDETKVFKFRHMGFEAGYRGHIGEDCTKCISDQAFSALHPANHYYSIEHNGDVYGYIGLTESVLPGTDMRVLSIDTIQSPDAKIPSKSIKLILDTLEKIALKQGYVGIALPDSLPGSFNHEQVRAAVENINHYRNGFFVILDAAYEWASAAISSEFDADPSESMSHHKFRMYTALDASQKIALIKSSSEYFRKATSYYSNQFSTFITDVYKPLHKLLQEIEAQHVLDGDALDVVKERLKLGLRAYVVESAGNLDFENGAFAEEIDFKHLFSYRSKSEVWDALMVRFLRREIDLETLVYEIAHNYANLRTGMNVRKVLNEYVEGLGEVYIQNVIHQMEDKILRSFSETMYEGLPGRYNIKHLFIDRDGSIYNDFWEMDPYLQNLSKLWPELPPPEDDYYEMHGDDISEDEIAAEIDRANTFPENLADAINDMIYQRLSTLNKVRSRKNLNAHRRWMQEQTAGDKQMIPEGTVLRFKGDEEIYRLDQDFIYPDAIDHEVRLSSQTSDGEDIDQPIAERSLRFLLMMDPSRSGEIPNPDDPSQWITVKEYFESGQASANHLPSAGAFLWESHKTVNEQIAAKLDEIAKEEVIPYYKSVDRYAFVEAVQERGRITTSTDGYIDIEDGVLVIVDERFKGIEHAGRGTYQFAVYTTEERKEHELKELQSWLQWARHSGEEIFKPGDNDDQLGKRLIYWANGFHSGWLGKRTVAEDELLRRQNLMIEMYDRFHREALIAEGRAEEFRPTKKLSFPITDGTFDFTIAAEGAKDLANGLADRTHLSLDTLSLLEKYKQRYGYLPEDDHVVQFVNDRIQTLLPDLASEDRPYVYVLASKGEGINAFSLASGSIIMTPELLEFVEHIEELDHVLLHEVNHWARQHVAKSQKAQTVYQELGLGRYQEHESDMVAFIQAAEPQRHSAPMGGIIFQERIRDMVRQQPEKAKLLNKLLQQWSLAHGEADFSDRIIVLKLYLHLMNMSHLESDVHALPEDFSTAVKEIKSRSDRWKLIEQAPRSAQQEYYMQSALLSVIQNPDTPMPVLEQAIRKAVDGIYSVEKYKKLPSEDGIGAGETLSQAQQDVALNNFKWLLQNAFTVWNDRIDQLYADVPNEFRRTAIKVILLETNAGIKVVSDENQAIDHPVLNRLREKFNNPDKQDMLLYHLTQALNVMQDKSRLDVQELFRFIRVMTREAVSGKRAGYDSEDGLDLEVYIQDSVELIEAATELIRSLYRFDKDMSEELITHFQQGVWTSVVFGGIVELQETGNFEAQRDEYYNLVQAQTNFSVDGEQMGNHLSSWELDHRSDDETIAPVQSFIRDHWTLPQEYSQVVRNLKEQFVHMFEISDNQRTYKNPAFVKVLMEIADLLYQLPPVLTYDMIDELPFDQSRHSQFERKFFPENLSRAEIIKSISMGYGHDALRTKILWLQLALTNAQDYHDWLENTIVFSEEGYYDTGAKSLEQMSTLIDMANDFSYAREVFGREPRLEPTEGHIERFKWIQIEAFNLFMKELMATNTEKDFFDMVQNYLQKWPVMNIYEIKEMNDENYEKIIQKGLEMMAYNFDEPLEDLDNDQLKKMLMLSFFFRDVTVKHPLQEYIIKRLAGESSLKDTIDLLVHDYAAQGLVGGVKTLDLLDSKAQDREDFDLLGTTMKEMMSSNADPLTLLGGGIVTEAGMKYLLERNDPLEVMMALLNTSQDDKELRQIIYEEWWKVYRGSIKDFLETDLYDVHLTDMPEWVRNHAPQWLDDKAEYFRDVGENETILRNYPDPERTIQILYHLSDTERVMLLRKLLAGSRGVLNKPGENDRLTTNRAELINKFFDLYLDRKKSNGLTQQLHRIFGALMQVAPEDELYMMMAPLLHDRIALPAQTAGTWQDQIRQVVADLLGERDGGYALGENAVPGSMWEEIHNLHEADIWDVAGEDYEPQSVEDIVEEDLIPPFEYFFGYLFNDRDPGQAYVPTVEEKFLPVLPGEYTERDGNKLDPMDLILDTAKQLGAPGVRFLQLLGYTIELPDEFKDKFLNIYDQVERQKNITAWETIKEQLPEYSSRIVRMERLGGGSLYTAFKVWVKADATDYPDQAGETVVEVVRVLNPNAVYHAKIALKTIEEAIQVLIQKDERYVQALPIVETLREWILGEIEDLQFETDDEVFHDKWNGKKPSSKWTHKVVVPKTIKTGTHIVRRESFVEGRNLTELEQIKDEDPARAKNLVALAAQHYIAQIQGGWTKFAALTAGEQRVHSDVSPGNLRETADQDLAILDRGFYLHLDKADRKFIQALSNPKATFEQRVRVFIDWLWTLEKNQGAVGALDKETVITDVIKEIKDSGIEDQEKILLKLRVSVAQRGLHMPIEYTLLFKNLNVLHKMAQQVGFENLTGALAHKPEKEKGPSGRPEPDQPGPDTPDQNSGEDASSATDSDPKGGIDLNTRLINWDIQGEDIEITVPDYEPSMEINADQGFVPFIINITPVNDLMLLLGKEEDKPEEWELSKNSWN